MPIVTRSTFSRASTDIEWPWDITGEPGSAIQDYGDSVRARIEERKTYVTDTFGATLSFSDVSDLEVYVEVTFPDQESFDNYTDYVNTDPDWFPAVPSSFGLTKSFEVIE